MISVATEKLDKNYTICCLLSVLAAPLGSSNRKNTISLVTNLMLEVLCYFTVERIITPYKGICQQLWLGKY